MRRARAARALGVVRPGEHLKCGLRGAELRYEIDKIQASQRLDLNLEKGRIRDELLTQNSKSIQTGACPFLLYWPACAACVVCGAEPLACAEIRLDKEINSMRTTLEVRLDVA